MTSFDRIKACDNEWEMADVIGLYISDNLHKFIREDGYFDSYGVLQWLRSEYPFEKTEDND